MGYLKLAGANHQARGRHGLVTGLRGTSGLCVGDPVLRTRALRSASARASWARSSTVFSPFETIGKKTGDVFIPRGVDAGALGRASQVGVHAEQNYGGSQTGGDIFGSVYENELVTQHAHGPLNVYGVVKVYGDAADGGPTHTRYQLVLRQTRKTHELPAHTGP